MFAANNAFSCYPGRLFIFFSVSRVAYYFKNRNWWTVPKERPFEATQQNSPAYAQRFLWNRRPPHVPSKPMRVVIQRSSLYWGWFNARSLWRYSVSLWTVLRVQMSLWRTDRIMTLRRSGRRRIRCVTNETAIYSFRRAHPVYLLLSSSCCINCQLSGTCLSNRSSKFNTVLPGITLLSHS